ncbi:MAG: aminotransferase class I/II-fold pyridoxal phosphate-dependent enzyme [Gammaproteobacteria bacterium]
MDKVDLLDKFGKISANRDQLSAVGRDPTSIVIDRIISPTEAIIDGKQTILVGTNNYLGLTFDPECVAAGQSALAEAGTGTTGSRMANGSYAPHLDLERELAEFYDVPHAMVFSTGYAANLGTLAALVNTGDVVVMDADAHASLYDGCRMSGGSVYRFRHNDMTSLGNRLRRLAEKASRTLIVVEGLYSVLGDRAPLREIVALKREFGAHLLVDEAHSLGIYGEHGRGVCEELGVMEDVDFVVGTFSKSLGATGGFCASRHDVLPLFRYASRPYIFTASGNPSVIATTRAALRQISSRPQLRQKLHKNAGRLYRGLEAMGLRLGADVSPVIAVRFEESEEAARTWERLLEAGIYTNLFVPPATPDGSSLLRCSVSAAHSEEQIDLILQRFREIIEPARSRAAGS